MAANTLSKSPSKDMSTFEMEFDTSALLRKPFQTSPEEDGIIAEELDIISSVKTAHSNRNLQSMDDTISHALEHFSTCPSARYHYLSLLYISRKLPEAFLLPKSLKSLFTVLAPDAAHPAAATSAVPSSPRKSTALLTLACKIIRRALENFSHWPVDLVKVYLEDFCGPKSWVELESCRQLADAILTAFPEPSKDIGELRKRFLSPDQQKQVKSMVLSMAQQLADSLSERDSPRPFMMFMAMVAGYPEIRKLATDRLEPWLAAPMFARSAKKLLERVVDLTRGTSSDEMNIVSTILTYQLRGGTNGDTFLEIVRQLSKKNTEYANLAIKNFILFDIQKPANFNHLVIMQAMQAMQKLTDPPEGQLVYLLQEIFLWHSKANFSGILKRLIKLHHQKLNLDSLCKRMLAASPKLLSNDDEMKEKWFHHAVDLVSQIIPARLMLLTAMDSSREQAQPKLLSFLQEAAISRNEDILWCSDVLLALLPLIHPGSYLSIVRKVLLLDPPSADGNEWLGDDLYSTGREKIEQGGIFLEETLVRVTVMGLNPKVPMEPAEALGVMYDMTLRAISLQGHFADCLKVTDTRLPLVIFKLSGATADDYFSPTVVPFFQKACVISVLLSVLNMGSVGGSVWENSALLRSLMEAIVKCGTPLLLEDMQPTSATKAAVGQEDILQVVPPTSVWEEIRLLDHKFGLGRILRQCRNPDLLRQVALPQKLSEAWDWIKGILSSEPESLLLLPTTWQCEILFFHQVGTFGSIVSEEYIRQLASHLHELDELAVVVAHFSEILKSRKALYRRSAKRCLQLIITGLGPATAGSEDWVQFLDSSKAGKKDVVNILVPCIIEALRLETSLPTVYSYLNFLSRHLLDSSNFLHSFHFVCADLVVSRKLLTVSLLSPLPATPDSCAIDQWQESMRVQVIESILTSVSAPFLDPEAQSKVSRKLPGNRTLLWVASNGTRVNVPDVSILAAIEIISVLADQFGGQKRPPHLSVKSLEVVKRTVDLLFPKEAAKTLTFGPPWSFELREFAEVEGGKVIITQENAIRLLLSGDLGLAWAGAVQLSAADLVLLLSSDSILESTEVVLVHRLDQLCRSDGVTLLHTVDVEQVERIQLAIRKRARLSDEVISQSNFLKTIGLTAACPVPPIQLSLDEDEDIAVRDEVVESQSQNMPAGISRDVLRWLLGLLPAGSTDQAMDEEYWKLRVQILAGGQSESMGFILGCVKELESCLAGTAGNVYVAPRQRMEMLRWLLETIADLLTQQDTDAAPTQQSADVAPAGPDADVAPRLRFAAVLDCIGSFQLSDDVSDLRLSLEAVRKRLVTAGEGVGEGAAMAAGSKKMEAEEESFPSSVQDLNSAPAVAFEHEISRLTRTFLSSSAKEQSTIVNSLISFLQQTDTPQEHEKLYHLKRSAAMEALLLLDPTFSNPNFLNLVGKSLRSSLSESHLSILPKTDLREPILGPDLAVIITRHLAPRTDLCSKISGLVISEIEALDLLGASHAAEIDKANIKGLVSELSEWVSLLLKSWQPWIGSLKLPDVGTIVSLFVLQVGLQILLETPVNDPVHSALFLTKFLPETDETTQKTILETLCRISAMHPEASTADPSPFRSSLAQSSTIFLSEIYVTYPDMIPMALADSQEIATWQDLIGIDLPIQRCRIGSVVDSCFRKLLRVEEEGGRRAAFEFLEAFSLEHAPIASYYILPFIQGLQELVPTVAKSEMDQKGSLSIHFSNGLSIIENTSRFLLRMQSSSRGAVSSSAEQRAGLILEAMAEFSLSLLSVLEHYDAKPFESTLPKIVSVVWAFASSGERSRCFFTEERVECLDNAAHKFRHLARLSFLVNGLRKQSELGPGFGGDQDGLIPWEEVEEVRQKVGRLIDETASAGSLSHSNNPFGESGEVSRASKDLENCLLDLDAASSKVPDILAHLEDVILQSCSAEHSERTRQLAVKLLGRRLSYSSSRDLRAQVGDFLSRELLRLGPSEDKFTADFVMAVFHHLPGKRKQAILQSIFEVGTHGRSEELILSLMPLLPQSVAANCDPY